MRIAIKATQIAPGGGLTHLNKIIQWFGKLAPEIEFVLLGQRGQEDLFVPAPRSFEYRFYKLPSLHLAAQIGWERQILPGILRDLRANLLFEPGNRGTLNSPCPKVTLLHNIAPFDNEYTNHETPYQKLRNSLLRRATIQSMNKSQGIIFLTEFCREYFSGHIDLSNIKSSVIYHGKPEEDSSVDTSIFKRLGIAGQYILSVSDIWRYKKTKEMIQSYLLARQRQAYLPPLIIAGKNHTAKYMNEIMDIIETAKSERNIIFTGFLGQAELGALYANCRAFLFPSVLETFSIILVESMAWGCAVAASNRSVVAEVTGMAALYFNPDDLEDFASKIITIATDERLNLAMREKAAKRARFFSWEKTARETLSFLYEVACVSEFGPSKMPELEKVEY
ncbi:MAG: hypothetical protein A2W25_01135 [candidate division Zixibacteria bacterium RBG_16_53_22]|nr:MAG: hypothetical protein A2W25_01135 [candidate division Zixibacteria bacterium RBG_16_53_22]